MQIKLNKLLVKEYWYNRVCCDVALKRWENQSAAVYTGSRGRHYRLSNTMWHGEVMQCL